MGVITALSAVATAAPPPLEELPLDGQSEQQRQQQQQHEVMRTQVQQEAAKLRLQVREWSAVGARAATAALVRRGRVQAEQRAAVRAAVGRFSSEAERGDWAALQTQYARLLGEGQAALERRVQMVPAAAAAGGGGQLCGGLSLQVRPSFRILRRRLHQRLLSAGGGGSNL